MAEENGHITADNETRCNERLADSMVPLVLGMFFHGDIHIDIHIHTGANLLKNKNKPHDVNTIFLGMNTF